MTDIRAERLRAGYAAMNAGDFEAAAAPLHDDAEWIDPPDFVGAGRHVGREAIVAFWESYRRRSRSGGWRCTRSSTSTPTGAS
ncbi:MAG TPA: nuclear transport factor 2 family protein [Thermoleophilaceae bacterium]|nr:nuclear transport factor 2 family protein [Thermoleophilaceae bacterium]